MTRCAKYFACVFAFSAVMQAQEPPKDQSKSMIANFPIPVGQSAKGVRFPYFENGKLKMFFNVDDMARKDVEHLQMNNAKIITYDDNGGSDLTLLLPVSLFDLISRVLTTDHPFVLKRATFELKGETLELDTIARKAKIEGKVQMIIYNFDEMNSKDSTHE